MQQELELSKHGCIIKSEDDFSRIDKEFETLEQDEEMKDEDYVEPATPKQMNKPLSTFAFLSDFHIDSVSNNF